MNFATARCTAAARAGLTLHDRSPAMQPTAFGLELVERFAGRLGRIG